MYDIERLKQETLKRLNEIEERKNYSSHLDFSEQLKRKYNTLRSLNDYKIKFPDLKYALKDKIKILEIGSGDGIALTEINETFNVEAVGTNIQINNGINSIVAYGSDLPFDNESFDLVIAIHSLTWEPDQKKAINEILRVLKVNGRAFVNLYKFSEITRLWFGNDFWAELSIQDYKKLHEFETQDFNDFENFKIRYKKVFPEVDPLTESYFIEILKMHPTC